MKKVKFKPNGERLLLYIEEIKQEAKTVSGIYIPESQKRQKSEIGTVVAVGEGKKFKIGEQVLFSKFGYDEIQIDGMEYYSVLETNVIGTL